MNWPENPVFYGYEDCGIVVMGRLLGWDGSLITQATIDSIAHKVVDLDANNTETASGALVVADVVYDAGQNDGSWPYDDGYNFRYLIPAAAFPTGGHRYSAEFTFTPTGAENQPFALDVEILARNRH